MFTLIGNLKKKKKNGFSKNAKELPRVFWNPPCGIFFLNSHEIKKSPFPPPPKNARFLDQQIYLQPIIET